MRKVQSIECKIDDRELVVICREVDAPKVPMLFDAEIGVSNAKPIDDATVQCDIALSRVGKLPKFITGGIQWLMGVLGFTEFLDGAITFADGALTVRLDRIPTGDDTFVADRVAVKSCTLAGPDGNAFSLEFALK